MTAHRGQSSYRSPDRTRHDRSNTLWWSSQVTRTCVKPGTPYALYRLCGPAQLNAVRFRNALRFPRFSSPPILLALADPPPFAFRRVSQEAVAGEARLGPELLPIGVRPETGEARASMPYWGADGSPNRTFRFAGSVRLILGPRTGHPRTAAGP